MDLADRAAVTLADWARETSLRKVASLVLQAAAQAAAPVRPGRAEREAPADTAASEAMPIIRRHRERHTALAVVD